MVFTWDYKFKKSQKWQWQCQKKKPYSALNLTDPAARAIPEYCNRQK
jgi:hypothetical protein